MALVDSIKKLSTNAVGAGSPVAVMFGTITSSNPLSVTVDQRFELTEDFLIVTERLTRYEIDLKHKHSTNEGNTEEALVDKIVIREGLKVGDAVLLLRMQGGQRYVVWDRVMT